MTHPIGPGPHGSPVPSPCVDVCTMDPASGLCTGCLRTIDEIAAWGVLDDAQKREVWDLIFERRTGAPVLAGDDGGGRAS